MLNGKGRDYKFTPGRAIEHILYSSCLADKTGGASDNENGKEKQRYGSPGRARTADLVINSHPLYQLSYRGITRVRMVLPVNNGVNKSYSHWKMLTLPGSPCGMVSA